MYRKYYSYNDMPMINNLAENTGRSDISAGSAGEARKDKSAGRKESVGRKEREEEKERQSEGRTESAAGGEIAERPAAGVRINGTESRGKLFGKFENDDILLLVVIFMLLADGCDDDLLILALAAVFFMGK